MDLRAVFEPTWAKVLACYLMVGWATQLPGGLSRRYLPLRLVREGYERHGPVALLQIPFVWIPFTILLWPIPFLRARPPLVLVAAALFGLLAGLALTHVISSVFGAIALILATGLIPTYVLKRGAA